MNINKDMPVAVNKCSTYDYTTVYNTLKTQFESIIGDKCFFENKNVAIKPNLLMKATPDKNVTTHPIVMEAVINIVKEYSPKSVTIAESPGGPYTKAALEIIYKASGMIAVADKCNVSLNYDTSSLQISNPGGKVCKVFDIISPIANADIIVDVCKIKTHSLTTMSAAVKNLFGTIPGIEKFEMHTRFKDLDIFEKMLADLCIMHCARKPILSIADGIMGMEGNGPSGGESRNFGLLLTSLNPFNLDIAISSILGVEKQIGYLEDGKNAGVCGASSAELHIIGEPLNDCRVQNLKLPDTKSLTILKKLPTIFGGRVNKFFEPRPVISNKCVGCGECARSCPAKTIEIVNTSKGKKVAKINNSKCIKCYCCQELCPINAVKVKKNPIFLLIK